MSPMLAIVVGIAFYLIINYIIRRFLRSRTEELTERNIRFELVDIKAMDDNPIPEKIRLVIINDQGEQSELFAEEIPEASSRIIGRVSTMKPGETYKARILNDHILYFQSLNIVD